MLAYPPERPNFLVNRQAEDQMRDRFLRSICVERKIDVAGWQKHALWNPKNTLNEHLFVFVKVIWRRARERR